MRKRSVLAITLASLLGFGLQGSAVPVPPPGLVSDYDWHGTGRYFGGFSALHISPDGRDFVALSDAGAYATGQFQRSTDGHITGITSTVPVHLKGRLGIPLFHGRADSEGLAIAPDGQMFVSFEGPARVVHYTGIGAHLDALPDDPDFAGMPENTSLESLAIDRDGTLFTLPETSGDPANPFKVYRFRNGVWDQPTTIPRRGGFLVSDASIGPDGRFYILERQFFGLGGFASRIRRFTFKAGQLTDEVTLLQTTPGVHDNLEGLAIWRDASGHLRATMVEDDNFLFFLRNEVVEYRLPD